MLIQKQNILKSKKIYFLQIYFVLLVEELCKAQSLVYKSNTIQPVYITSTAFVTPL
jgi:hypothetical protein